MTNNITILRGRNFVNKFFDFPKDSNEYHHNYNVGHRPMVVAKGDILLFRGIIPVAIRHLGNLYLNYEYYSDEFTEFFYRFHQRALEFYPEKNIIMASEADMISLQWFIEGKEMRWYELLYGNSKRWQTGTDWLPNGCLCGIHW